jgi:uncharacterized protein
MSSTLPPRPDELWPQLPPPPAAPGTKIWPWWEALLIGLAGFLLVGGIAGFVVLLASGGVPTNASGGLTNGPEIGSTIVGDLAALVTILIWLHVRYPRWRDVIRFPSAGSRLKEAAIGIGMGALLYPAVVIAGAILNAIFNALTGHQVTTPEQLSSHITVVAKVLAVILAIVVAPIAEEFFFRGVFFGSLRARFGFWPGAIGSGILFGLAHFEPAPAADALLLMSTMIFTGIGLAAIYNWRGRFMANAFAHATFNVVGVVLILTHK